MLFISFKAVVFIKDKFHMRKFILNYILLKL